MNDQTCNKVTYVLWLILDDVVLALTTTGTVKVWTLFGQETKNSEPFYENESKQIRCLNALSMTCCAYNQRTVLIVCSKYWQVITVNCIWKRNVLNMKRKYTLSIFDDFPSYLYNFSFQIYDAGDFSVLCSVISPRGERWLGGDFLATDRVVIWSDEGRGYMYKLPAK